MLTVTDSEAHAETAQAPHRSVLWRAASIIDAFNGSHRVLSLNELSRRSYLPKSTAHRFAEQLLEIGWLERELGGYRVGMRLFEVGTLAERRNKLRDKALPHLHSLAAQTGKAVNLGILDHYEVLYVDRVPVRDLQLPTRDGGRMPLTCTGIGKALLAYSSPEDIELVLGEPLPRLTEASIDDRAALEAELESIRRTGVAFDHEEACRGVSCIAAPIRGSGRAVAAISLTAATEDFNPRLVPLVKRVADNIWADLFPRPRYSF